MKLITYCLLCILCLYTSFLFAQDDDQLAIGTVVKMTFEGQMVEAKLVCRASAPTKQEEEDVLMNIHKILLEAEKEALILPIRFYMVDDPVTDGIFIFGLEAIEAETLTLELYEEEGFVMVLNCAFEVEVGSSYKVLDLGALESGNYIFRLKNKQQAELNRIITVEKS